MRFIPRPLFSRPFPTVCGVSITRLHPYQMSTCHPLLSDACLLSHILNFARSLVVAHHAGLKRVGGIHIRVPYEHSGILGSSRCFPLSQAKVMNFIYFINKNIYFYNKIKGHEARVKFFLFYTS